ncbi:MAG: purine-nucleoside phosphorylase [Flavipsychrobacter sp.]|nr:purine-nucleoside phosphorylase [Flavipsychrobacter sp.]
MSLFERISETASYINEKLNAMPVIGIISGSGLGGLTDILEIETEIDYELIPHFPVSTVAGHSGKLVFGKLGNKQVLVMSGRFHYYEGYDMDTVTFPVRVMKALGVETLIVSNAAGGMNENFKVGDMMLITDHINLFPEHPLRGHNDERLGVRFPDMSETYDPKLIALAKKIAAEKQIPLKCGVYIGLQGPTFETPAEYRWLHVIGGDAVGMSTVPEVIVAIHSGMRVFAISIITDIGISAVPLKITHEEVLEAANAAAPKLAALVTELIKEM